MSVVYTGPVLTVSTTGNIDDLDFGNARVVRFTNATLTTLRGLKAGVPGQQVTLLSLGAGQVGLANQNAGSAAANRIINLVTSFDTPLAAGVGIATVAYDGTTARWRLISHFQGAPISFAFNAADFTTNGATETWTVDAGDVETWAYYLDGDIALVVGAFNTTTTAVAADATTLKLALPWTNKKTAQNAGRKFTAGAGSLIWASAVAAGSNIALFDLSFAAWPLAVNDMYVFFEVPIPVT